MRHEELPPHQTNGPEPYEDFEDELNVVDGRIHDSCFLLAG
jgi:hypothetical protein